MLWTEVDVNKISLNEKRKLSYDGGPFRFQIPECTCIDGLSEYNQMTVEVPYHFVQWYHELEKSIGVFTPWNSNVNDGTMTLKIDESTQIFDANKRLTDSRDFQGCMIKCILEVSGVYFFREIYGLTCRVYQIMSFEPECKF
jgi:Family of unknown function (DUF5871)